MWNWRGCALSLPLESPLKNSSQMIREDGAHGLLGHPSNGHPPFAPVEKIFRILNRRQGRVVEERSFARCFRFDWLRAKGLQKDGLEHPPFFLRLLL